MEKQESRSAPPAPAHPGMPDVSAVVALIRHLSVAGSVDEIAAVATQAARGLLNADGLTFILREGQLCYYVDEDAISPLWKGRRFPVSDCISGWCMTNRLSAVVPDIRLDPRIPQDAYRPTFVHSLVMVPVRQLEPIAAMGAYWASRREATAREVDLLQAVADAASLALAKVELERQREKEQVARSELSHRLTNMLSVIDAMARQTLRGVRSPTEFAAAFTIRLQALARAQILLSRCDPAGVDLRALIREQLMVGPGEDRISCRGPEVFVGADDAFDLGLVLHELGTNARKHGALSNDTGRAAVEWTLGGDGERRLLALSWIESGGPPVAPPSRTGFGSRLIRHSFRKRGGGAEVRFEPTGVVCEIRIPLS